MASRESDTALSPSDLLPYLQAIPEEFHSALGVAESKGTFFDITFETPEFAVMLSQAVLCAASEILLRLFNGNRGCDGDIGAAGEGLVASRQSLQSCAAGVSRRRLRVIGHGRTEPVGESDVSRVESNSERVSSWRHVGEREEDDGEM